MVAIYQDKKLIGDVNIVGRRKYLTKGLGSLNKIW